MIDDDNPETKTLRGSVLLKYPDGLWRDAHGTIYALPEDSWSVDKTTRAGVGIFSLPEDHPLSQASGPHDYAFTSPTYQAFHTRIEADLMQLKNIALLTNKKNWRTRLQLWAIKMLLKRFSDGYWENEATSMRDASADLSKTPNENVP